MMQFKTKGKVKCNHKFCKTEEVCFYKDQKVKHLKGTCLCGKPISKEKQKQMNDEFMQYLAEEINIARSEGQPTSRLTALAMKCKDLFK